MELKAVYNSNLAALVLEKFHEPPIWNLGLSGAMNSNLIPSKGSIIVSIFKFIESL
jgi:hypothetical protein